MVVATKCTPPHKKTIPDSKRRIRGRRSERSGFAGAFRGQIERRGVASIRQNEKALEASLEHCCAILNSMANSITVLDNTGHVIASNKVWNRFENEDGIDSLAGIGVEAADHKIGGQGGKSTIEEGRKAAAGIKSVIEGFRQSFEMEYERATPSGPRRFRMMVAPRLDGGGGAIVTYDEIMEASLAEEGMLELSRQLIVAQEKERSRIALELHDDLSQRLALISFEVVQLGRQLPASTDEYRRRTQEIWASIQSISTDIHRIAYQLHPSKLDALGLTAALNGLCNEISSRHELRLKFIHRNVPESLPKDLALCLFRIAQEALNNVIKHSGAKEAEVVLTGNPETIHLRIADAGRGFDIEAGKKKSGLGLISMRERIRLVGGEISIKSEPSRGVQIEARIPLNAQDS